MDTSTLKAILLEEMQRYAGDINQWRNKSVRVGLS